MKKPYRYFLIHESIGGERELNFDPYLGQTDVIFARDTVSHGIGVTTGLNVSFVKDGYDIIKAIYETFGVNAEILFRGEDLNRQINDYELFYFGAIDLQKYVIEEDFVSVALNEAGLYQKFKSREDVLINMENLTSLGDFAIPPFDKETELISLHSKTIFKKYVGIGPEDPQTNESIPPYQANIDPPSVSNGFSTTRLVSWTGYSSVGLISQVSELSDLSPFGSIFADEKPAPFYIVKEPGPHKFKLDFDYDAIIHGDGREVKLRDCAPYVSGGGLFDNVKIEIYAEITNSGSSVGPPTLLRTFDNSGCGINEFVVTDLFSTSFDRSLLLNDEVNIYFKFSTNGLFSRSTAFGFVAATFALTIKSGSKFEISALTQSPVPTSPANALLAFEAFTRVAQSITDLPDPVRSTLYGRTDSYFPYSQDGEGALRAITNGLQIRQFPLSEKPLFASWKDLFAAFNALDNIGVGIENNKLVIEKKEYFYTNDIIFTVNDVTEFKKSVASEYYYNEIENGFSKWENEEVNGLDEFNSSRNWSTCITAIKNKLSILCTYIGSGYAIEFTRRKTYLTTSTEDWKYDNDNFIISVVRNGTGYKAKTTEGYSDDFANILDPSTAYNLDLSPKRSLIKWGNVIKAGLLKYLDKSIKFAFGTANYIAESKRTDEDSIIVENTNLNPIPLQDPLWIPEYYEFEGWVSAQMVRALRSNPYGMIEFTWNKNTYWGFLINIKIQSELDNRNRKKTTFKLLRANYGN